MFGWRKKRRKRQGRSSVTKHYVEHKETARELTLARLAHFNQHYNLKWNRVAIRNQRRCWGSCSSLKNLNFNYKILLLPDHLRDYIIVHELCHLVHLNHGEEFWNLVGEQIPEYKQRVAELRAIDKLGHSIEVLTKVQDHYHERTKVQGKREFGGETSSARWCQFCGHSVVCNCMSDTGSASDRGHQKKRRQAEQAKK